MTKNNFSSFFSRLKKYYGSNADIDDWARDEYYKACFCVHDRFTKKFYSDLLDNYKFFPKVGEFREIALRQIESRQKRCNAEFCYYCLNTGIIPFTQKGIQPFADVEYESASRCFCDAGGNYPEWPLCTDIVSDGMLDWIQEEHRSKYGKITPADSKKAKEYVTTFIKSFGGV